VSANSQHSLVAAAQQVNQPDRDSARSHARDLSLAMLCARRVISGVMLLQCNWKYYG